MDYFAGICVLFVRGWGGEKDLVKSVPAKDS